MSQAGGVAQATTTTAYAGAPAPAATAPSAPGTIAGRPAGAKATTTTPGWLAQWRLVIAAVCIIASAVTAFMLFSTWQDTRAASADTAQLVRVQTIKVNLLRADALATNAFLVGGLEPAEQRAAYDTALAQVERTLTDAAAAQPADRAALAALNDAVLTYTSSMELARANNRQGFPVGAAYLTQASTGLRSTALPLVDNLVMANQQRSRDAMSPLPWILVVIPGLLALLALGYLNRQLAARFRRRLNVGIVAAGAATLVMVVLAGVAAGKQGSEDSSLLKGSYATVVNGVIARSAANDAKANESLRLISRGSGETYEKKWSAAATTIVDKTSRGGLLSVADQWRTYAAAHAKIVELDTAGNWDQAVAAATSSASGSSTADFTAFDTSLREVVDAAGSRTTADLDSGRFLFLGLIVLALLAGLAGAASAWRGVTTRLEEYA